MKLYRKRAPSQVFSYDLRKVLEQLLSRTLGNDCSEGIAYKTKSESEWSHGQLY